METCEKSLCKKKKVQIQAPRGQIPFRQQVPQKQKCSYKKTYKLMLRAKERFQLYYYGKRMRFYSMKKKAKMSLRVAKNNGISSSKVFFNTFEQELHTLLYRAGFVSSALLSKKFLNKGFVKINKGQSANYQSFLKRADLLQIDPVYFNQKLNHYLKSNFPYIHSSRMRYRKAIQKKRNRFFSPKFLMKYGHKRVKFCNRFKFLLKILSVTKLNHSIKVKNV